MFSHFLRAQPLNKDAVNQQHSLSDQSEVLLQTSRILESQGLLVSRDGTAAMVHGSSTPNVYYEFKYGIRNGINMVWSLSQIEILMPFLMPYLNS